MRKLLSPEIHVVLISLSRKLLNTFVPVEASVAVLVDALTPVLKISVPKADKFTQGLVVLT